jgi:hypothetical protein
MREFTIRKGNYVGKHIIYDSIKEANENGITDIKLPWYAPGVEPGSWVVSDDGYVVQCLARRNMVNKRHKSGQYTDTLRFPQGTFWVYYNREGRKTIKNFYAAIANSNKNSLGNTSKLGRYMTSRKKYFVSLVVGGMEPFNACAKVFNMGISPPNQIFIQVNKLLNDPLVREAIMEQMKPFMQMVTEKIKEKSGHDNLLEFIAEQIAMLVTKEDLSPKEIQTNIKLMLEVFSEQLGLKAPPKDIKKIQEVGYEEVAPPALS